MSKKLENVDYVVGMITKDARYRGITSRITVAKATFNKIRIFICK